MINTQKKILALLTLFTLSACQNLEHPLPQRIKLVHDASHTEQSEAYSIHYKKYQLDNGLTLLLVPDNSIQTAYVNVKYHVGSAVEQPGQSGFAHLFEHMMFQGSAHVKPNEHIEIIESAGGKMNGTTDNDLTNYYEKVPANHLKKMLWLEADRMGFLLPQLTQKNLDNQIEVVLNERIQRLEQPYGRTHEVMLKSLYPADHPYSRTVIGEVEDIKSIQLDDVRAFFKDWYGPQNATLTIAGQFNEADVLQWVDQYFGSIPRGKTPKRPQPKWFEITQDRYVTIEDRIHVPLLNMETPTLIPEPHNLEKKGDAIALSVLSYLLQSGKHSLFYTQFVKPKRVLSMGISHNCLELLCTLNVYAAANPKTEPQLKKLEQDIRQALNDFDRFNIQKDDFKRVRAALEMDQAHQSIYVSSQANTLSTLQAVQGKIEPALSNTQRLFQSVTLDDLRRVHKKYIQNKHMVIVSTVPQQAKQLSAGHNFTWSNTKNIVHQAQHASPKKVVQPNIQDTFDRSVMPEVQTAEPYTLAQFWEGQLSKDRKILGIEDPSLPITYIQIHLKKTPSLKNIEHAGIEALAQRMLFQATQKRSAQKLSHDLDMLSSSIHMQTHQNGATIQVMTLTKYLDETLAILEEALTQPLFEAEELKRHQTDLIASIGHRKQDDGQKVQHAFQKLLYGTSHPFAQLYPSSVEAVKQISIQDIQDYYDKMWVNSNLHVTVYSDAPQSTLESQLKFLNTWHKTETHKPFSESLDAKTSSTQPIYFVETHYAKKAHILVGRLDTAFRLDDQSLIKNLMNYTLGGNFNSRLNQNLREDKGYTYGISSSFSHQMMTGSFKVQTQVAMQHAVPALQEILLELEAYQKQAISEKELKQLKSSYFESDVLDIESPLQKLQRLSNNYTHHISAAEIKKQKDIVSHIDTQALLKVAQQEIESQNMIKLVAGSAEVKKALMQHYKNVIEIPVAL